MYSKYLHKAKFKHINNLKYNIKIHIKLLQIQFISPQINNRTKPLITLKVRVL